MISVSTYSKEIYLNTENFKQKVSKNIWVSHIKIG